MPYLKVIARPSNVNTKVEWKLSYVLVEWRTSLFIIAKDNQLVILSNGTSEIIKKESFIINSLYYAFG